MRIVMADYVWVWLFQLTLQSALVLFPFCEFFYRGRGFRAVDRAPIPCGGFARRSDIVSMPRYVALHVYKLPSTGGATLHSMGPERSSGARTEWLSLPPLTQCGLQKVC